MSDQSAVVIRTVTDYFCRQHSTVVTPETLFKEDLGFDSLDILELIIEIENVCDIHVRDDEIVGLTTVQSLIDLVNSKVRP